MASAPTILEYFRSKASAYDDVEKQVFWRLSDELLWHLLVERALQRLSTDFRFLDAGGGTGRWSERVLRVYAGAGGTIRDLSVDMLQIAAGRRTIFGARLELGLGTIEAMPDLANDSFDLVYNFHNVIGFLEDPAKGLTEMARVLRPGGFLVTVAPNRYHLAFFNLTQRDVEGAEGAMQKGLGRFTSDMPPLKAFTPRGLQELYGTAGLEGAQVFGFPKLVYPGFAETQLHGTTERLGQLLETEGDYARVLALERAILFDEESAARGNNLFAIAQKPIRG